MKGIVGWFARNTVASNLLMLLLVLGGLVTLPAVRMELFPEFSLDLISVAVPYPGAAPEEVEEAICVRIEEEVHGIEGIKKITSTAVEGMGTVMIEVRPESDARRVLDDVKTRVDAIDTFPVEAEQPIIQELLMRRQVVNIAVFGPADEATLKHIAEGVRDDVNALPGITQVTLANTRPYEISIELSEDALRRHGLTFDQVANAVRLSSLDLSGGSVKTEGGEVLLRTKSQKYRGHEFEEIEVMTLADGTRLLLGDVATVVDGFEDTDQSATFNGFPVAMIQVFRVGSESALQIADDVQAYIDEARVRVPEGIQLEMWQNNAVYLQGRLDLLLKNGFQGLVGVFLVLALLLKFRLSFWVTIGIPISFLGVVFVMPALGVSINMLTLFGFILVLGIVVDDAIVVGENIYKEHSSGHAGVEGAIRGVRGVSVPVIFAVLTTLVAFVPMLYLPGIMGKFFGVIPMVVLPALVFSLVESQLILPAHLSHARAWVDRLSTVAPFKWWVAMQTRIANGLDWFVEHVYRPTLRGALEWRYATVAVAISSLLITGGIVAGGFVKFVFFPDIEGDILSAQITMPEGTSAKTTEQAVRQVERAALQLTADLRDEGHGGEAGIVKNLMASVGEQPYMTALQNNAGGLGGAFVAPHLGEVVIELTSAEERELTSTEIVRRWRELCGPIPGVVEADFNSAVMSAGDPVFVQFSGPDITELGVASAELKAALSEYEGVFDVSDSFRGGKQELVLDILPQAQALGLTRADLARQVRQAFYGEEAQRVQRGRDELKVMVRLPEEDRSTLHGLESMRVRTPDGAEVPFSTVARAEWRRGSATIKRTDRNRTVDVTADIDLTVANPGTVLSDLESRVLPEILSRHRGVRYSLEGQNREQVDTIQAMLRYYAIALFAIFGLMAIPFRSYLQPFIIMSAIPFGVVGAILGHLITGHDLSILSVLGLAALAGVVVNDSLVLVDYVNRMKATGLTVAEAARQAGAARFRPILLTSLTTFVGLLPLILERSVQAQFLIPMAISLAFGVLYTTFVSLLLVPAAYLILEDLKALPSRVFGSVSKPAPATES